MKLAKATAYILKRLTFELPSQLSYHSLGHTLDVVKQARRIALAERIDDKEKLQLLETAAYYHDAGFLETYQNHEEKSCEIAQNNLPAFGYSPSQIEIVCKAIMATKIPQTPTSQLGEILCDADLDYLGRADFFSIGDSLYQELVNKQIISNRQQWDTMQVSFLQKHEYFTAINQQMRCMTKGENLLAIQQRM